MREKKIQNSYLYNPPVQPSAHPEVTPPAKWFLRHNPKAFLARVFRDTLLRHNPKPFLARVFRDAMSMADRDRRDKERGRLRRRRSKERDKERGRLRRRRSKERMREQRASEMGGEGWLDELLAVDAWETGVTAAVSSGATERAVALVHKAPAGAVRSGHGSDLLYRACERGQPAVADALLALGADANATHGTGRGDTALMIASGGGTTGLDMRAMHGRYWSYLGNDLQGRPRAADRQGITGRFNAVEPKMEGTPHTGRSDADRSNSADLEVGTKCAAELSTSSCGADDAGDGVAACTRANSVPMLLGVGDAGKAAGYYMSSLVAVNPFARRRQRFRLERGRLRFRVNVATLSALRVGIMCLSNHWHHCLLGCN